MRTATVSINTEQESALNGQLDSENAKIAARNAQIQANKDLAAASGVPYVGPEPAQPLTFDELIQQRFDERVRMDIRARMHAIAEDLTQTYMDATPEKQAAMMADLAKYKNPPITVTTAAPTKKKPSTKRTRKRR